jgi:RNA polymerase sigma factor (sigma-70 family)
MNNEPGLHELIHQIGDGDPSAIEAIHDRMRRPLQRYLQSRYSPPLEPEDVEDVVQYTFIQIFLYARTYRGAHNEASAKKWIHDIARHRAIRLMKVAKLTSTYISFENDDENDKNDGEKGIMLPAQFVSSESTEDQALNAILIQEVSLYASTLSDRERDIIAMRTRDLKLNEIGENFRLSKPRISQILNGIVRNARRRFGMDES